MITVIYPSAVVGRTVTTILLLLEMPITHTACTSVLRMSTLSIAAAVLTVVQCVVLRIPLLYLQNHGLYYINEVEMLEYTIMLQTDLYQLVQMVLLGILLWIRTYEQLQCITIEIQ